MPRRSIAIRNLFAGFNHQGYFTTCVTFFSKFSEVAAERLALLALGWAWTLLGSIKNSKPEKRL
jgi:hypothetical protein